MFSDSFFFLTLPLVFGCTKYNSYLNIILEIYKHTNNLVITKYRRAIWTLSPTSIFIYKSNFPSLTCPFTKPAELHLTYLLHVSMPPFV